MYIYIYIYTYKFEFIHTYYNKATTRASVTRSSSRTSRRPGWSSSSSRAPRTPPRSGFFWGGFGRYGVVYFYGCMFSEYVLATGVEAGHVCAKFSQQYFEVFSLEPLLNHHFINYHLRVPDKVQELWEECRERMYSLPPRQRQMGLGAEKGIRGKTKGGNEKGGKKQIKQSSQSNRTITWNVIPLCSFPPFPSSAPFPFVHSPLSCPFPLFFPPFPEASPPTSAPTAAMSCVIPIPMPKPVCIINMFKQQMGAVWSLYNFLEQGYGYEYHGSGEEDADLAGRFLNSVPPYTIYIYTYIYMYIYIYIYICIWIVLILLLLWVVSSSISP